MSKKLIYFSVSIFMVIVASINFDLKAQDFTQSTINQQITVKGRIVDDTGQPITGATISVVGSTIGSISDERGNYTIEVPNNHSVLKFSFIGFNPQERKIAKSQTLNISLNSTSKALNEVVVVGYGVQTKADLSGAVASVASDKLVNRPITNIPAGLQGLMPGITVTTGGARPGQDAGTIRIRGVGTLNNSDPYILIDGMEVPSMNGIDPNDIENISVLKDASSAAIYGSKAANGVILITTKHGKAGKLRISYSGNVALSNPTAIVDRVNSADYAMLLNRIDDGYGRPHQYSDQDIELFRNGTDPYGHPNTNWYKQGFQTGFMHKHNVNISGGTDMLKYMASLGYMGQTGVLRNSDRKQFNGRTNLDMNLTKKLTVHLNLSYIKNDYKDPNSNYVGGNSGEILRRMNTVSPMIPVHTANGDYGPTTDGNPVAWLDSGQTVDRYNQIFTGLLGIDYTIIDGLKFSLTGSYIDNDQHYHAFVKRILNDPAQVNRPNTLDEYFFNWSQYNLDALLNYDKKFGQHGLKVLVGYHAEKYNYRENKMFRKGFPNNDMTDMDAGTTESQTNSGYNRELAMLSYFGRINYDYAGKYLLEANFRSDASSRFSPAHRWGYFPSFSGAWRLTEEQFMENTKTWLSSLKIRGSWGKLGNQNVMNKDQDQDYYPWINTYNIGGADGNYAFGGNVVPGYYQKSFKTDNISWETTTTWGVGIDGTIKNKVNFTVDYYNRKTNGIIMQVPVPDEFGLDPYAANVGGMTNKGVEIQLGYNNHWNDWSFGVSGNFAYNKNTIDNLGGVNRILDNNKIKQIGSPVNSWYVYKSDGFFNSDQEAQEWMKKYKGQDGYPFGHDFKGGDLKYVDTNGDGKITAEDRVPYLTSDPVYTYGLNINAGYKNFDLTVNFTGAADVGLAMDKEAFGEFTGSTSHPATIWLDSWTPDHQNARMPRVAETGQSPSLPNEVMSDFWILNTSYVRLKTLQFGYTIPKKITKKWGIENLRIYYSAENLFTIDSMPINVDPENTNGSLSGFPITRTNSFGVNLTF